MKAAIGHEKETRQFSGYSKALGIRPSLEWSRWDTWEAGGGKETQENRKNYELHQLRILIHSHEPRW